MGGVIGTFIQPNMERLMEDVRQGTLDFVLTKPDDAQVLVSVREIRIWQLVDVVIGVVVLGHRASRRSRARSAASAGARVRASRWSSAASMIYCFWLILTTGGVLGRARWTRSSSCSRASTRRAAGR